MENWKSLKLNRRVNFLKIDCPQFDQNNPIKKEACATLNNQKFNDTPQPKIKNQLEISNNFQSKPRIH